MKFLRYIAWLLRALLFIALLLFALKNTEPVTLHLYLDQTWRAPLILVHLGFFAFGAALGVLACLTKLFAQRREILALKKDRRVRRNAPVPPILTPDGIRDCGWFSCLFGLDVAARIDITPALNRAICALVFHTNFSQRAAGQGDRGFIEVVRVDSKRSNCTLPSAACSGGVARPNAQSACTRTCSIDRFEGTVPAGAVRTGQDYLVRDCWTAPRKPSCTFWTDAPTRGAQVPAGDLPAGEGLGQSDRHRRAPGARCRTVVAERNRQLSLRAGSLRGYAFTAGAGAAPP
jgi:uncharacterized integral membrane protein